MTDQATARFLDWLHRGGSFGYWWALESRQSFWWEVGERTPLPGGRRNIYVGVHPTAHIPEANARGEKKPPQEVRSQLPSIAAINCLFSEYDAKDFGGDKDAALAKVDSLDPPPSVVVDSGGGYHAYWLLKHPWRLTDDRAHETARRTQAAWVRLMDGDPQSKDLARVLRVPGTRNYKYSPPRPVTIVRADMQMTYTQAALMELAAPFIEHGTPATTEGERGDLNPWLMHALSGEIAKVAAVPDGQKHKRVRDSAIALGGLVHLGLSERVIEDSLFAAIEGRASDPRGARKTIQDGIMMGMARPRDAPESKARVVTNGTKPPAAPEPQEGAPELFHCTDLGNAKRLVAMHGHELRYVHAWGAWLVWDGTRWVKDQTGEVDRRARTAAVAIYAEAAACTSPELRKEVSSWARKTEARSRLDNMIALAQSEPPIPVKYARLDTDPFLFNCQNGTVDLRTGQLRPHRAADLITKYADVAYDPDAECPAFMAFLYRVMNDSPELVAFLQRAVGYSLTGDVSEQCLFFAYGTGKNGKSTFFETLAAMLCDYQLKAPTEMLMTQQGSSGVPSDVARITGARLVVAAEIEEGRRLAESKVKDLTGGDTLTARFLHQDYFEFKPTHKLWIYGNHKPIIRGTDEGIWRRIRLIPFSVIIPPEERDPRLKDKLKAELPGILAWAVDGCLAWQSEGLQEPIDVSQATEAYRTEMDVLAAFIGDCCSIYPSYWVAAGSLYEAYKKWCEDGGEYTVTQRRFSSQLTERGFDRRRGHGGQWRWHGIGLAAQLSSD